MVRSQDNKESLVVYSVSTWTRKADGGPFLIMDIRKEAKVLKAESLLCVIPSFGA